MTNPASESQSPDPELHSATAAMPFDQREEQAVEGPPEPWSILADTLAAVRGLVMVVGMIDAGKTTFVGELARRTNASGRTVAIIDADVGQSSIGPPGCIGMHLFHEEVGEYRVRRPDAFAFVGTTSPAGVHLDIVGGVLEMTRAAGKAGAELAILDTTGLNPSPAGLRLKEEKLLRVRPQRLVLIENRKELSPLAQLAAACSFCEVHRVPPAKAAHSRPTTLRRAYRKAQFEDYFKGARIHRVPLHERAVRGMALLAGRALSQAARLRIAEYLEAPALRAEVTGNRLSIVTPRFVGEQQRARLQRRFPGIQVAVHGPGAVDGLLVGLESGRGTLLDIGIVRGCDFTNRILSISTPLTDFESVRLIHFGLLRLKTDGTELEVLRPGAL